MLRPLYRYARLRALAHRRKHGDRTGQLKRTRVINHKGGRCLKQAARRKRDDSRKQEIPRHDAIGKRLHTRLAPRFACLRLLHERNDRAQLRVARIRFHPHEDLAILDSGARKHVVANRTLDGERLTGQRGLVHHGDASLDNAVDADGHTRSHHHEISLAQRARRNRRLLPALDELGGFGHIEERVDELAFGARSRVLLERFAEVEQEHRLARCPGIALDKRHADGRRVENGNVEPRSSERTNRRTEECAVAP